MAKKSKSQKNNKKKTSPQSAPNIAKVSASSPSSPNVATKTTDLIDEAGGSDTKETSLVKTSQDENTAKDVKDEAKTEVEDPAESEEKEPIVAESEEKEPIVVESDEENPAVTKGEETEASFFSAETSTSLPEEEEEDIENARIDDLYLEMEPDPVIPVRWRPYFPLLVFFATLWLMFQLSHELRYYWAKGPVTLGDISDGCEDLFYKKATDNSFVRIKRFLPDLESTTEARVSVSKYNYTFAMGCDLLIAVPAERYQKLFGAPPPSRQNARKKPKQRPLLLVSPQGSLVEKQGDVQTFAVQGRILRLADVASLQPVRDFYRRSEHSLPARTLVLFDGEAPHGKWWVLLLYGMFLVLCWMSLQRFLLFTRMAEDDQAALEAMEAAEEKR